MIAEEKILPKDWRWVKLGEVCDKIIGGGTPSTKVAEYWKGEIPWISSADIEGLREIKPRRKISIEAVKNSATNILPKGGIIVVTRVGLGKLAIAPYDICFSQDSQGLVLEDKLITQSYALICLSKAVQKFKQESRGTTINGVTKKQLTELQIPLPPKPTQQAIVSKIEELFSELDKGIEQLKTAQQQLKTYRQSVLKWAFEGKLTSLNYDSYDLHDEHDLTIAAENEVDYKTKNNQVNQNNHINHSSDKGALPKGWKQIQIKDVAETYGGYAFKSGEFKGEGRYQVLRMGNVRPGILRYDESPVFLNDIDENVLNRSLLQINDIIITQTGTRKKRDYGFTALISKPYLLLNQRIAAIRFNKTYLPKFFLYFSWTDKFKDQFFANETGNVGQGNVGMKAVTETFIPLCSIEEQNNIVQEIESRLSVADKMEESINQSLLQAEALRQSILKKAFEGRLVI